MRKIQREGRQEAERDLQHTRTTRQRKRNQSEKEREQHRERDRKKRTMRPLPSAFSKGRREGERSCRKIRS